MWSLAQADYNYNIDYSTGSTAGGTLWLLIVLAVVVLTYAGLWKMFEKAGVEGWKGIIPIYNVYVLIKLVGWNGWYLLLFLIPFVNFIFQIVLYYNVAKAYGQGLLMTILEFFGIGFIIMGFGSSKYVGPAKGATTSAPPAANT